MAAYDTEADSVFSSLYSALYVWPSLKWPYGILKFKSLIWLFGLKWLSPSVLLCLKHCYISLMFDTFYLFHDKFLTHKNYTHDKIMILVHKMMDGL